MNPGIVLNALSNLSALPAIIVGWKRKSLLWYYACIDFLADASSYVVAKELKPIQIHIALAKIASAAPSYIKPFEQAMAPFLNMMRWIANTFIFWEFILIGIFLTRAILKKKVSRLTDPIIIGIGVLFLIRSAIIPSIHGNYVDGAILLGIFIILCLFALKKVIQEIAYVKIERSPLFIFSSSFLLYASGAMLILLFKLYLDENQKHLIQQMWPVLHVLNIVKNLAIARVLAIERTNLKNA